MNNLSKKTNTLYFQVCEKLANGEHETEQKAVQAVVQKFNSATVFIKVVSFVNDAIITFHSSRSSLSSSLSSSLAPGKHNHPDLKTSFEQPWCDKGGRKGLMILCISGKLVATAMDFLNYMVEAWVGGWVAIFQVIVPNQAPPPIISSQSYFSDAMREGFTKKIK